MSNKGDRVQKWGELLAELAEDAKEFDREKRDKILAEKKKYSNFYQTIESDCANFQPNKLRQKLNTSLKNNYLNPIIVFSFTCNLAKCDDYQNVVLNAFKTKAFLLMPFNIFKAITKLYFEFLISKNGVIFIKKSFSIFSFFLFLIWSGLLIAIAEDIMGYSLVNSFWQWLVLASIGSVFIQVAFFITFLTLGLIICGVILIFKSIFSPNSESLIADLADWKQGSNRDLNKITIKEHRNIKLPELRLLFLELDKFGLQPILIIKRKNNLKVNFELQIKNSPKFRELLQ